MPRSAAVLSLILSSVAVAQAGLRVNEISTASTSYVEIANLGPDVVYMGGHKVYWGCNTGTGFVSGFYTFPGSSVLYPGQTAIVTESVGATLPATPLGVFKAYIGSTILWATMPSGSPTANRNGVATLVSPSNVGLDRVQWGTNTANFDTVAFGATFGAAVTMTLQAMHRKDNSDTNTSADWAVSLLASAGNLTPPGPGVGGQSIIVGLQHAMSSTGAGDLFLSITTSNPPLPGAEVFNLISLINLTPDGSGPIFGVGIDALSLVTIPAAVGNPFHTFLDGAGAMQIAVGPGSLPIGLHLEGVALTVVGGAISRISSVSSLTL